LSYIESFNLTWLFAKYIATNDRFEMKLVRLSFLAIVRVQHHGRKRPYGSAQNDDRMTDIDSVC